MNRTALRTRWERLDAFVAGLMNRYGLLALRLALAVVFIWFGALKVLGVSPVADLIAAALPWFQREVAVPALGVWEIIIGLGLLFRFALRLTLLLFFLLMLGTLLVLVLRPDLTFMSGNPFRLTTHGEFIVKNLVLLSAGLVVGSTVRPGVRKPKM